VKDDVNSPDKAKGKWKLRVGESWKAAGTMVAYLDDEDGGTDNVTTGEETNSSSVSSNDVAKTKEETVKSSDDKISK